MASPTSATEWKKNSAGIELRLPSDNVCLVKRPGLEKILATGVIPDELAGIAMDTIKKAGPAVPQDHKKKGQQDAAAEIDPAIFADAFKSTDDIFRLMDSFDRITEMCVLEPKVKWHKEPRLDSDGHHLKDEEGHKLFDEIDLDAREDDVLYTDDVDLEDKMFIFNFVVGGSADVEQFREEFGDGMDSLQAGEDVARTPEPIAGTV